jgi:nitroreductase
MSTNRKPQYKKVLPLILNRWSARAMSGESITHEQLMTLFEAARWAPSSFNNQPWRFIYALKGSADWDLFFNLLVKSNQGWCKNAAVLVVIVSKDTFDYDGKPARTHSFDTGAAWQNLALQGSADQLVVHGMQGFSYDRAKIELAIPDGYTVEAMFAIGKPGKISDLPLDQQAKEKPSDRRPMKEIVAQGTFTNLGKE